MPINVFCRFLLKVFHKVARDRIGY